MLEVKDLKYGDYYAMKVIRSVKRYIESAETEAKILFEINDLDKKDKYHICRLFKTFHFKNHYFMIFEKMGKNLY